MEHVGLLNVASTGAHGHEGLAVHSASARDQVPVELASPEREIGREGQHVHVVLVGQEKRVLWEADVVADADAKVCVLRLELCELGRAAIDEIGLKESDASGDVDVEQVLLPVLCNHFSVLVEAETRVEDLLGLRGVSVLSELGNRAPNYVGACLLGQTAE